MQLKFDVQLVVITFEHLKHKLGCTICYQYQETSENLVNRNSISPLITGWFRSLVLVRDIDQNRYIHIMCMCVELNLQHCKYQLFSQFISPLFFIFQFRLRMFLPLTTSTPSALFVVRLSFISHENTTSVIMTNTHRSFYFSSDTSRFRKFSRFVRPGQIPSLSRRDGVKFLTTRISRARGGRRVFHFTYTRSSYDRNQHVDRGIAPARGSIGCTEKRHSMSSPRGADRTCTVVNPIFTPRVTRW